VKHLHIIITLFVLSFLLFETTDSQTQKIAYVNSAKILDEFPEAQEAQKKLELLGKQWQDEFDKINKSYQDKLQEYQKKSSLMTEEAKKTAQQELLELEQKAYDFRQQKLGQDGELEKQRDKLLTPIKEKILKAIEQVAKEQKFTFVFDKNEQIQFLLFGESTFDVTFDVLSKLKRGK
jgi:outer membrane protein